MSETASDRTPRAGAAAAAHSERLYLPWYHWILPLVAAGLLAAEIHMGYPGVRAWLPYLVLIPLTLLFLVRLSTTRVAVHDGELCVADARVPLRHIGEVEIVSGQDKRRALGPELDPAAFVRQRGWVRSVLRVQITDARDPTPYWVFSTRHPQRLRDLLLGGG